MQKNAGVLIRPQVVTSVGITEKKTKSDVRNEVGNVTETRGAENE